MKTAAQFPAMPAADVRACQIGNVMTDFCAIVQALKPLAYADDAGCARDYLLEKLGEAYHALEALHQHGQVH